MDEKKYRKHFVYSLYAKQLEAEGVKACTICGLRHRDRQLFRCKDCREYLCVGTVFVDHEKKTFCHHKGAVFGRHCGPVLAEQGKLVEVV